MIRQGNSYWLAAVNSITITMVTLRLGFVGTHSLVFREMKKKEGEGRMGDLGFQSGKSQLYFTHYDNAKGKDLKMAADDSPLH